MLKKLLDRLIVYIYDSLEVEKLRREKERLDEIAFKKDAQQRAQAAIQLGLLATAQANCNHLKGGSKGLRMSKDYNVIQHTMPDGRMIVKCVICGKEWSNAAGNLKEGFDLMRYSTNTATSSEVSLGKLKDQDKVTTDAQKAVAEAANKRPSPWGDQENDVLFPWAGKNWPTIWEKGLAKLKRAAARKKKAKVQ